MQCGAKEGCNVERLQDSGHWDAPTSTLHVPYIVHLCQHSMHTQHVSRRIPCALGAFPSIFYAPLAHSQVHSRIEPYDFCLVHCQPLILIFVDNLP